MYSACTFSSEASLSPQMYSQYAVNARTIWHSTFSLIASFIVVATVVPFYNTCVSNRGMERLREVKVNIIKKNFTTVPGRKTHIQLGVATWMRIRSILLIDKRKAERKCIPEVGNKFQNDQNICKWVSIWIQLTKCISFSCLTQIIVQKMKTRLPKYIK